MKKHSVAPNPRIAHSVLKFFLANKMKDQARYFFREMQEGPYVNGPDATNYALMILLFEDDSDEINKLLMDFKKRSLRPSPKMLEVLSSLGLRYHTEDENSF